VGDLGSFSLAFTIDPAPVATAPDPVLSPCIGICNLGDDGYCEGCARTGDEIATWLSMTPAQRLHLMDVVLPSRTPGSA
jgi:predicted Fe-S protein YdhL (DUF1289 family)